MAFSKSKVKRFPDVAADARAPPVGTYDPKLPIASSSVVFSTTQLDHSKNSSDGAVASVSQPRDSQGLESEKQRKNNGQSVKPSSLKQGRPAKSGFQNYTKIQESELEVKRLLKERMNLIKQLTAKDLEGRRLFSRLQAVIRERSSFQASLVTFEKENKELHRINDLYKIKLEGFEGNYKHKDGSMEMANLRAQLASKEHIISDLRMEILSTRRELEISSMKMNDRYRELSNISALVIDAMNAVKTEVRYVKSHIIKMQITEECADDFYECVTAQLQSLDEKLINYTSDIHSLVQQKNAPDLNHNVVSECPSNESPETEKELDLELKEGDLSFSQTDGQDLQTLKMEKILSSTLVDEEACATAENYFQFLKDCRIEEEIGCVIYENCSQDGLETAEKRNDVTVGSSVSELQAELELKKDECDKLRCELEKCQAAIVSKEADFLHQLGKIQEKCGSQSGEISNLSQTIEGLKSEMAAISEQLKEEMARSASETRASLEKSAQISDMDKVLEANKELIASLENNLAEVNVKLEAVNKQMACEQRVNEETLILLKNKINTRETKVKTLLMMEVALKSQVDIYKERIKLLQDTHQELTHMNDRLIATVESSQSINDQLSKDVASLHGQLDAHKAMIETVESQNKLLNSKLELQVEVYEETKNELAAMKEIEKVLRTGYEKAQMVAANLREDNSLLESQLVAKNRELEATIQTLASKEEEIVTLAAKLLAVETTCGASKMNRCEELENELSSWKTQCEELQAKIAPFQEQLDSYAFDRQMLMSKNMETMNDLKALSLQYATSLGHQNRKQKIHYMSNLKEENFNLKEENGKLWADILKLRTSIHKRDGHKTPSTSRFPLSANTPVNKENKDGAPVVNVVTALRDCSNNET